MDELQKMQGVSREKYWKELTSDEKVERMRMEVKTMQFRVNELFEMMFKLGNNFEHHSHLESKIVIPINLHDNRGGWEPDGRKRKSNNPDEVYF